MSEKSNEQTLCGWCGKPIKGRAYLYTGEYICKECNSGLIRDKYMLRKIKKGERRNG